MSDKATDTSLVTDQANASPEGTSHDAPHTAGEGEKNAHVKGDETSERVNGGMPEHDTENDSSEHDPDDTESVRDAASGRDHDAGASDDGEHSGNGDHDDHDGGHDDDSNDHHAGSEHGDEGDHDDESHHDHDDDDFVPCFTPGTVILTSTGERRIEELRVGDKVVTRDDGLQEIRWIGSKPLNGRQLLDSPHLRPIFIRKGSLGRGLPERDMKVSPNHRMLVANENTTLLFEEREVLVAAKHLIDKKGIQQVNSVATTYIHMMFDNHEVILANGSWTESFQPGDYSLKGIGNAQRAEIFELFPELRSTQGKNSYVAARRSLNRAEALLLN